MHMKVKVYLCTFFITQKPLFGEILCYLRDVMPRQWSPCFFSLTHVTCMGLHHTAVIRYSTSVTSGRLCHASGQLAIYRECYGFERAFLTFRSFLPYTSSCFFQGFPRADSLTGLHADLRNIAPDRLFVWITAIHKRFICGRFYLRAMAGQS